MMSDEQTLGTLDRLTRRAAMVISRRGALKGALGVIATGIGIRILSPMEAAASCCQLSFGECVNCHSGVTGCSCDGSHCVIQNCDCGSCGNCGDNFYAAVQVCDDGSYSAWCTSC
jgi:hypothetical protein